MRTITRESTAWQFLANKLDTQGRMSLYKTFFSSTGERCLGLCAEITQLHSDGIIDWDLCNRMDSRIDELQREREAPGAESNGYLWPKGRVKPRIIAAQLFALLAKQEERRAARIITATLPEDRIAA